MLYARLFWRMMRYRVAVMLVLFLLLGAASAGSVPIHAWQLALAGLALAASYVSATSSNDLADQKIDAVNHAGHRGRPLVSGEATPGQMRRLFILASVLALGLSLPLGLKPAVIMGVSIAVNIAYSLPPLRLSYRTWLAPLVLAVGYVGVPFLLGAEITAADGSHPNWLLALACYSLFVGRIVLKDFRDRAGDAKYGKPTLLLAHGKTTTLVASGVMVAFGTLLVWLARPVAPLWLLLAPTVIFALVLGQLVPLHRASPAAEQPLIGIGAKLGNGALIILLGLMLLQQSRAPVEISGLFAGLMLLVVVYSYWQLSTKPAAAVNAYRG